MIILKLEYKFLYLSNSKTFAQKLDKSNCYEFLVYELVLWETFIETNIIGKLISVNWLKLNPQVTQTDGEQK